MIDRHALVHRHHPVSTGFDPLGPFTVGNGRFAFTADATGFQTFPDRYDQGIPLHTQSQWGWHATPRPETVRDEDVINTYPHAGRAVPYADRGTDTPESESARWLRANPHRLDLGRIGLDLRTQAGTAVTFKQLVNIHQTLNLWHGHIQSEFTFANTHTRVTTACHPQIDAVAFRIETLDVADPIYRVCIKFPYGSEHWKHTADWQSPDAHQSVATATPYGTDIHRTLDDTTYTCAARWERAAKFKQADAHTFLITPADHTVFEIVIGFSQSPSHAPLPKAAQVFADSAAHWESFWNQGGAINLHASRDPRAPELERRLVLSQYLTAVNCAGDTPPQETGLTCNSWFGKMHLEMHWWHATHFALWNRAHLLRPSLDWYLKILPKAREHARRQGFPGVRWPKMVDNDGVDSPSAVAVFLLWQQPHPIYLAELLYRDRPCRETLERYAPLVFESAEFMAAFATLDPSTERYNLLPPLIPAQESYGNTRATNCNPTYELAYWHWALGVAKQWRQRLGQNPNAQWDRVRSLLAAPSITDGRYDAIDTPPHLIRKDHPSMLAALGVLPPTPLIDTAVMSCTLDTVLADWDWPSTWGWDYPMMAMTAARLGRPHNALDALFHPAEKNRYLNNGHNYQDPRLPIYLPGNGGLLTAVAIMAAGWDHTPDAWTDGQAAPGFPTDGSWVVQHEGLCLMP